MKHQIGIRREDKNRWERRVPIVPEDMEKLIRDLKLSFRIQPSPIRVYSDQAYQKAGAELDEDLSPCQVVFAVKEIPMELLKEKGVYVFFSHTIKGQPYNMEMLKRILELECTLIDYERITDDQNRRLIFFGRFAGIAGMIDSLWCLAQRLHWEDLRPNPFVPIQLTYRYENLEAAKVEIGEAAERVRRDGLPVELCPFVVAFTGYGNVSIGAQEMLDLFPVETLEPEELPSFMARGGFDRHKLYKTVFKEEHLVVPREKGTPFQLQEYYDHPERYRGVFEGYLSYLTVLMNCIYWDTPYPRLVTKETLKDLFSGTEVPRLRVIGDISCDVEGAVACTAKTTTPDKPSFVYAPEHDRVIDGVKGRGPVVMAVDNLPCELPLESSQAFSSALIPYLEAIATADYSAPFPALKLPEEIKKAVLVHRGAFTSDYKFMENYLS